MAKSIDVPGTVGSLEYPLFLVKMHFLMESKINSERPPRAAVVTKGTP